MFTRKCSSILNLNRELLLGRNFVAGKMLESIFIAFLPPAFLFHSLGFSNTDTDDHAQWHTLTPTYRIGHISCHMNLMTPTQTCWNSHQIREQQLSEAHALPHSLSLFSSESLIHTIPPHTQTLYVLDTSSTIPDRPAQYVCEVSASGIPCSRR